MQKLTESTYKPVAYSRFFPFNIFPDPGGGKQIVYNPGSQTKKQKLNICTRDFRACSLITIEKVTVAGCILDISSV